MDFCTLKRIVVHTPRLSLCNRFTRVVVTLGLMVPFLASAAFGQTGPVVSDLVIATTDSSATLTFTTDKGARSVVDFGTSVSYDRQVVDTTLTTVHSIDLDTLAENSVYHFQLTVTDSLDEETVLPDSTFMTDDVTGPMVTNLVISTTDSSATITFDTDEPASSSLSYGLTSGYDSTIVDTTLSLSHSIQLDSLDEATLYHFELSVSDSVDNETVLGDSTFVTHDVTAPEISNLLIATTDSSAIISFDTSEPASSSIQFGTTVAYGSLVADTNKVLSHIVTLPGLDENALYHFEVTVADTVDNETVLPDSTFMTDDVSGPVVSNLLIATTDSSATISFDTDEPATSSFSFGLTATYDSTIVDTTLSLNHLIQLDSLDEATLYHFAVNVSDSLGNETVLGDSTFTTDDVTPPEISNLVVTTTDSSATLTFDTSEPASSSLAFGLTATYDSTIVDTTYSTSHSIQVDSLDENTIYHYLLAVSDSSSNSTQLPDSTFRTKDVSGPVVSNLAIAVTDTSATITFDTDEPASSALAVGLTAVYDSTIVDTTFSTSHSIVVDSLDEYTLYHFQLTVTDSLDFETVLPDSTFMTLDVTDPVISNIVFSDTTEHTVRVQWTTDEPTTGYAEIEQFRIYDDTLRTEHDLLISTMTHRTQSVSKFKMLSNETYAIEIVAFDSSGNRGTGGHHNITTLAYTEDPLPAGWMQSDVGPVAISGTATYDPNVGGGMFRLKGGGTNLYWDEDNFFFAYHEVDGDFIFTTKVHAYAGVLARNTKASTHFRADLSAGSRMFNQSVNYDDTDRLYYRVEQDSNHVDILRSDLQSTPGDSIWVRLHRSGNDFTEYYSSDGVNWTVHGPSEGTNVKLPSEGFVGMTALSRNANGYSEIFYTDVLLEQPADTTAPVLTDFTATGVLDTLNIDFEVNENVTAVLQYGYFVPYSDSLVSDTLIADNFFQLTGLTEGVEYNYRIVMTDAGGNVVEDQNRTYVWGLLPVELVDFSAIQVDEDVLLKWSTASEVNSTQFDVEMAPDDGDFASVGFVEAAGQSTSDKEYSFRVTDIEPGNYRFRLKHIDTEGLATLSDEIEVQITLTDAFALSDIYPNPFNPTAKFTLMLRDEQDVTVEVYDMLGRRVQEIYSGTVAANSKETFDIDGSNLSSGLYLIRISGDRFSETKKVTLLK